MCIRDSGSATAEEITAMEAYSGWGGAQKAFSEKAEGEWGEIRGRLKELLSDDEFASQRHTVLTAFYTPAPVIGAIYDALREAGIGQGDTPAAILEPGCGTGNFMRLAPARFSPSSATPPRTMTRSRRRLPSCPPNTTRSSSASAASTPRRISPCSPPRGSRTTRWHSIS